MTLTLGKEKRLKSQKSIEKLFLLGKSVKKFPLRAVFSPIESETFELKIAVSVPKKRFKKAVDRNLLKRRMREAFRLNQTKMNSNQSLRIMFIYTGNEISSFEDIQRSMLTLIELLNSASNGDILTK